MVMQHGDGLGASEPLEGPTPSECKMGRRRCGRMAFALERRLVQHAAAAELLDTHAPLR